MSVEAPAKTTASPTSPSACRKCGQFKNFGKASCCALGGAWFNNCGDPGDSKFDHTWYEGIQACKDSARSSSGKARAQDMFLREATVATLLQNSTREDINDLGIKDSTLGRAADVKKSNSGGASYRIVKYAFIVTFAFDILSMR